MLFLLLLLCDAVNRKHFIGGASYRGNRHNIYKKKHFYDLNLI